MEREPDLCGLPSLTTAWAICATSTRRWRRPAHRRGSSRSRVSLLGRRGSCCPASACSAMRRRICGGRALSTAARSHRRGHAAVGHLRGDAASVRRERGDGPSRRVGRHPRPGGEVRERPTSGMEPLGGLMAVHPWLEIDPVRSPQGPADRLEPAPSRGDRSAVGRRARRRVRVFRPLLLLRAGRSGLHRSQHRLRNPLRLDRAPRQCLGHPVPPGEKPGGGVAGVREFCPGGGWIGRLVDSVDHRFDRRWSDIGFDERDHAVDGIDGSAQKAGQAL